MSLRRHAMTEDKFWKTYDAINGEVEAAVRVNHTYLTIHRLGEEEAIDKAFNNFPDFWRVTSYSLQTTLFIALGRIFDTRSDSHSIQKLVEATIAHDSFFSKAALRDRKRTNSRIYTPDDPDWLTSFLEKTWEPSSATDLECLHTELLPYIERFKAVYKPIRHKAFAHKAIDSEQEIWELFGKTLKSEINDILRILYTELRAIWELAWNGKRIDLQDFSAYGQLVAEITEGAEGFIRSLV